MNNILMVDLIVKDAFTNFIDFLSTVAHRGKVVYY